MLLTLIALVVPVQDAPKRPMGEGAAASYEKCEFTSKDGDQLAYWLMKPSQVKKDEKYPLVVCLHGKGGNSTAASVLAKEALRKKYPAFVMAPAAAGNANWASPDDRNKNAHLPRVIEAVKKLLETQPIDADRVYVTGQSMGGYGSWGAAATAPGLFAAAVPVCGGWSVDDAAKIAKVAIWAFHGAKDPTVPVTASRTMIEALKKAGAEPKFTEYEGVGHNSWEKAYGDDAMWEWLFAQKRKKTE